MAVSPTGVIIAEAGSNARILTADLDPHLVREWRSRFPALADVRRSLLGDIAVRHSGAAPASGS